MIAENILRFGRMLRSAGMPVGPDRVLAAVAAIEYVGIERREDVHTALGAVMLDRREQQVLFDAAFDAFWRDPGRVPTHDADGLAAPRGPSAAGQSEAACRSTCLAASFAACRPAIFPGA